MTTISLTNSSSLSYLESAVPFRLVFRWIDIKFDVRFLNISSSQYKTLVSFTESQVRSSKINKIRANLTKCNI